MTANMVWFTAATLLAALLTGVCALEKQIKLEDIERDNLQTELLKQTQRAESGQPQAYAYHQQHQPQQQQQQQQQQQPQHSYHTLPQLQQHLQQDRQQQLAQQHHLLLAQHNYQSPMLQPQHVMPTIMYLIMPNGNVAALQLAPHPNHLQPYYGAATKQVPGTLYHQLHGQQQHQQLAAVPMQILQYYQPPVPQIQYVPQTTAQRYQPHQAAVVQHQTQHIFSSPQAQQAHAQHFSSLAPSQQHLLFREAQESVVQAPGAELSAYGAQSQGSLGVAQSPQSHKSAYVSGAKSTASPQLKGSFSTQTGSSYANFRQYG